MSVFCRGKDVQVKGSGDGVNVSGDGGGGRDGARVAERQRRLEPEVPWRVGRLAFWSEPLPRRRLSAESQAVALSMTALFVT